MAKGLGRVTESQPSGHSFRTVAAAVIGMVLVLHLVTQLHARYFQPDGVVYSYWALKLANGKLDFDWRAPLFQLMIACSFRLFGAAQWSAAVFPQLLGILTTLLIFAVARLMYGNKVGLVALTLALTNLGLMNLSAQILRETLLSALVVLCIYAALRFRGNARAALLGSLVGLLYWVREDYVALLLPLSLYLAIGEREGRSKLVVLCCSAAVVSCPWAYYSLRAYGTLTPSTLAYNVYWSAEPLARMVPSIEFLVAGVAGMYYELYLLPSVLTVFSFVFLIPGICGYIKKNQALVLGISATILVVQSSLVSHHISWPMPWSWTDSSRYVFPGSLPLLVFSAKGIIFSAGLLGKHSNMSFMHTAPFKLVGRHRVEGIMLVGILLFGAGYLPLLWTFDWETEYPYRAAGQYMRDHGFRGAVISFHPELLKKYYAGGEVLLMPSPPQYATILQLARARQVPYLLVDWSMTDFSEDIVSLYWAASNNQSVPGFEYLAGEAAVWAVFEIQSTS